MTSTAEDPQEREKILQSILERVMQMSDYEVNEYITKMAWNADNDDSDSGRSYATTHHDVCMQQDYVTRQSDAFSYSQNQITWARAPETFLVTCKPNDPDAERIFVDIVQELKRLKLRVLVEQYWVERLHCVSFDRQTIQASDVDLAIVVGGDGSLLYLCGLFPGPCPPIVAVNTGSLGFMAPFEPGGAQELAASLMGGPPLNIVLRWRLMAYQKRQRPVVLSMGKFAGTTASRATPTSPAQKREYTRSHSRQHAYSGHNPQNVCTDVTCRSQIIDDQEARGRLTTCRFSPLLGQRVHTALNEFFIEKVGSALTMLVLYINSQYVGTVQADGLIIATASGSTAYSLSAGGVPVQPSLKAVLVTPVCPHVSSSKPLVLTGDAVLKVKIGENSRGTAALIADGKKEAELQRGDQLVIALAPHPVPTVCKRTEAVDWFQKLRDCLGWNVRVEQKGADGTRGKRRQVGDYDSDPE